MARAQTALWIGVGIFAVDQTTKQLATTWLRADNAPDRGVLDGWFSLEYTINHGAAFGSFTGRGNFFVFIALLVIIAILVVLAVVPLSRPSLVGGLGLQLGGAAGNVADRLRHGYVVDFVQVRHWPVFNVADSCIVLGSVLLMYAWFQAPRQDRAPGREQIHQADESARPV